MELGLVSWRRLPWFDRAGQFSWLKTLCLAGLVAPGLWVAIAWYLADRNAPLPVDPGNALLGGGNVGIGGSALGGNAVGGALPLGAMPVTEALPYSWWDTPNIHFCTIRDFVALCDLIGAEKERAVALDAAGGKVGVKAPWWFWNLFGAQAVFLLKRG